MHQICLSSGLRSDIVFGVKGYCGHYIFALNFAFMLKLKFHSKVRGHSVITVETVLCTHLIRQVDSDDDQMSINHEFISGCK